MAVTKAKISEEQTAEIWALKRKTKRSWVDLRRGCQDLLGKKPPYSTFMVGASSRSFARKITAKVGLTADLIIEWLDASGLGVE